MNTFVKTNKRKLILGALLALLFFGFKTFSGAELIETEAPEDTANQEPPAIAERSASLISYGAWAPTEVRTVLGQVVSDGDISVKAETNGTIARVNVDVGTKVTAGQVLASFKTSGDPSAINYQSALSSLETTRLSNQNSIRSAEISVENARKSLAQTAAQQDQNYDQAYEALRLESQSIKTLIDNAIETIDKHVQFTNKYQFNQDFAYAQIGNTDSVRRQSVKNQGQQQLIKISQLQPIAASASESQILQDANARLQILKSLQQTFDDLEILVQRTVINSRISESQIQSFLAAVEGVHNAVDARVSAYQGSIDRAKGAREQSRLAVLGAQNSLESALAGLELSKSQASAQAVGAQNQVNIAGASTADLIVRAPISGTITSKTVRVGDLVNPGSILFNIVNESQDKKVIAFLNQDERQQAQNAALIEIEIEGKRVPVTNKFLSAQIDAQTQKSSAEFTIPAGTTLVGNLATVRIPIGSGAEGQSNLIPFSSVSFEPDGAEVLVLNDDNIAERQKIVVGRVVVSNIEVTSGIELGQKVVEYYKRVLPGERVVDENAVMAVETNADLTSADIINQDQALTLNLESTDE
jgi:multidrug efflux pump subunit AcrA (membrane-fusion protein)